MARGRFRKNVVEETYEVLLRNKETGELEARIFKGETYSVVVNQIPEGFDIVEMHEAKE